MWRILRWVAWSFGVLIAGLIVAAIVTARAGNPSLYPPPPGAKSIEVLVASNLYHSGIILPREALAEAARRRSLPALAAVADRFEDYQRIEFGWGDEGFYTSTPTTKELTTTLALRALFRPGNLSVLHAVGMPRHPRLAYPSASVVALQVDEEGFARLATMLDATFARGADGKIEELGRGLYGESQFYRAVGTFNVLRVCNHWIADLLDAAGVPTAPVLATLPQGLLWDLATRGGAVWLPPASGRATQPTERSHAQSQADARLLELRPHPSSHGRPREAGRHRSRHSDFAAAAVVPAHAGR